LNWSFMPGEDFAAEFSVTVEEALHWV